MTRPPTMVELIDALRHERDASRAAVERSLAQIERLQPRHGAFVAVQAERARATADRRDAARRAAGRWGALSRVPALHGVPVALKDNIDQAGEVCAAGCRAYADRVPYSDAAVVALLRRAGAVIVGRTAMHELADGVTSDTPAAGPVRNPWRPDHHPGGSSGGSAVAVADGSVPLALGTDTGGSVRIPAALCGVVGFKPSMGVVPLEGVLPLSTTLDHVGPLARCVADVAQAMTAISDAAEAQADPMQRLARGEIPAGVPRIGVLEGFGEDADAGVGTRFGEALQVLQRLGARLQPVAVPSLAGALRTMVGIYGPEAAATHAEILAGRADRIGAAVRADLERGRDAPPQRHRDALRERDALTAAIDEAAATAGVELLVCPTTPAPASPIGAPDAHRYLRYTCAFNVTGRPAISVPMGWVDGLPVGLQMAGARGHDAEVLGAAAAFERALGVPAPS